MDRHRRRAVDLVGVGHDGMYAQLVSLQQELLKAPSEERTKHLAKFDLVG